MPDIDLVAAMAELGNLQQVREKDPEDKGYISPYGGSREHLKILQNIKVVSRKFVFFYMGVVLFWC